MKSSLLAGLLVSGLLVPAAQAGLIHSFNFSPDAPLIDDVANVELTQVGNVAFSPEGFATFDGSGGHLWAEALNSLGGVYTVSFWIRSDDYAPGEEDKSPGIMTATDENPFALGNWGVTLRRNTIRFGGKALEQGAVSQDLLKEPVPGMWQLITLKFNGIDGSGAWVNEELFVEFESLHAKEGDPRPAFKDIVRLIIGSDFAGKISFIGDIADIRIYDDVEWTDAKQVEAYQAGPKLGAPAPQ